MVTLSPAVTEFGSALQVIVGGIAAGAGGGGGGGGGSSIISTESPICICSRTLVTIAVALTGVVCRMTISPTVRRGRSAAAFNVSLGLTALSASMPLA